jgi:hypothetical protein
MIRLISIVLLVLTFTCELGYARWPYKDLKDEFYSTGRQDEWDRIMGIGKYGPPPETPEEKAEREARQVRQAKVIAEFQGRPSWDRVNWNGK